MDVFIKYFIVVFFANTIGASSGIGGGVIIKPVLDTIGAHTLSNINFFSNAAVFVMSAVSIIKQIQSGIMIDFKNILGIAFGSITGGFLGSKIFNHLVTEISKQETIQLIQIILTVLVLTMVLLYFRFEIKPLHIKNPILGPVIGVILGALSTILGIGGGPINVMAFLFLFNMSMKNAVTNSIVIIFFSQLTNLISLHLNEGFHSYDISVLWSIIPAAILGGYVGTIINQRLSDKINNLFFRIVILGVILLNIVNVIRL